MGRTRYADIGPNFETSAQLSRNQTVTNEICHTLRFATRNVATFGVLWWGFIRYGHFRHSKRILIGVCMQGIRIGRLLLIDRVACHAKLLRLQTYHRVVFVDHRYRFNLITAVVD